jgi:flagellar biosynthetic protein FliR
MDILLIYCWLMVGFRGLGIVLLFPTLGAQHLPVIVRVALSFILATILYPLVRHAPQLPTTLFQMITATGGEMLLGIAMGFIGRLVFETVEVAGRMINQEIGLGGVPGIDTPRPSQEPLAALMSMFAALLFFLSGTHLGCLVAFAKSFEFAPAGQPAFGVISGEALIAATGHVIELGFRIAAPFIALNFLTNLSFSVLSRAVPKMNVFVLSYSFRIILGLSLLSSAGMLLARYLWADFGLLPGRMLDILPVRG